MRTILLSIILLLSSTLYSQHQLSDNDWKTRYEKSGFKQTSTYQESLIFCKKLAASSSQIHYTSFGKSARNKALPLLIIDKEGDTIPDIIQKKGRLILLIEANIHPGEPDGIDAMFMLLRDMVIYQKNIDLLNHISILFIPVFNVDGHERFGAYNRINQNGPEEMGWRTTAQNLNLNRDFMKADAPEMKAWLKLFNRWMPHFFIDTHTTDGADYQYVITYALETSHNIAPEIGHWLKINYLPEMTRNMFEKGHPVFPYVSFRNWHDPRSGLYMGVAPPMLSNGYTTLHNRPGLLIETHMLKPYKARVESTEALILYTMKALSSKHQEFINLIAKADTNTASPRFREMPFSVKYKRSETDSIMVDFLGVEYHITKSNLTGGDCFVYDSTKPMTMKLPLFTNNIVEEEVWLPNYYIIPPEWTTVIDRLQLHGVKMQYLSSDSKLKCKMTQFSDVSMRNQSYEGRQIPTFKSQDDFMFQNFPAGSAVINMDQKTARVIAHLLEPRAWDSFVYWGFFNAIFEQKEYAESYVMETLALEMLKKDPGLQAKFEKYLTENPSLKNNQWAILNWFYQQTPWADERLNLYPVGRLFDNLPKDIILRNY